MNLGYYIAILIFVCVLTMAEFDALYKRNWKFPIWNHRYGMSTVFVMSMLAMPIGFDYGWVEYVLSVFIYVLIYIALYFYITKRVPRRVQPKKISVFDIIFWIVIMSVIIFGGVLRYPQSAAFIINFSLFNIFFLFLPLYYLFEIREQKLEEKRQQDEERRKKEEQKKMRSWAIVTKEINTNSKSEEEQ